MSGGIMGWIFGQVVNVMLPVIQQSSAFLIQTMSIPILKVFGFSSKEFYDTFAFISTTSKGVNVLEGCPVAAHDLRAGAAMILAGLVAHGKTEIYDIFHIERGYENIVDKFKSLGANIELVKDKRCDCDA